MACEKGKTRNTLLKSRYLNHVSRFAFFAVLVLLLFRPFTATAQTQPNSYWQYRASGRLQHVITADMNGDGIAELIVADENGKVDIIDANGKFQQSYAAPGPVLAIHTIDTKMGIDIT